MKNSKPTSARTTKQPTPRQSPAPVAVLPEEIPSWMAEYSQGSTMVEAPAPVQATEQPWWTQQQEETPWWVIQPGQGTPLGQKTR